MKRDHVELEKELNKIFQKKGYPGMAVSIRGPEGILFEKGFGIRNGDSKLPVDQDTVFGIASMSKSMTALALCILQTEGKLDLKDPIVKYFPDMHIPGAPDECVTLEIIAMHRAGIPPMPPLEWSIAMNSIERDSKWYRHMVATAPNKMDKIEDIVEYISKGDYKTLGAPGEYMSYSNDGYALLSYVAAGTAVINGFGKSAGLVQIQELGTIESPIVMTNTFSVGTAVTASVKYMLEQNEDIGVSTGTVNCVVTECNDGELNDIRGMHVTEEHVLEALRNTGEDFEEGAVGSGTGMCCMGLKGGIGSASRIVDVSGKKYTIGAILMSNFGVLGNLRIDGKKIHTPVEKIAENDKGSVIIVIGTDLPLTSRQLNRISRRAAIGLGRTGSYLGNGSGDIALAFSTTNRIPHYSQTGITELKMIQDDKLDDVFEAVAETVEEAVISSLYHAKTVTGIRGRTLYSLLEFL